MDYHIILNLIFGLREGRSFERGHTLKRNRNQRTEDKVLKELKELKSVKKKHSHFKMTMYTQNEIPNKETIIKKRIFPIEQPRFYQIYFIKWLLQLFAGLSAFTIFAGAH